MMHQPANLSGRRVDIVAVKGKEKPTCIYEIIDGEPDTSRLLKEKTLVSFSDGGFLLPDAGL
jgi:hypothetical protein